MNYRTNTMTERIAASIVPPPARLRRCQTATLQTTNEPTTMTAEMYLEYVTYHTNVAAQTAANAADEPTTMTAQMYLEYVTYHTNVAAQTAANAAANTRNQK